MRRPSGFFGFVLSCSLAVSGCADGGDHTPVEYVPASERQLVTFEVEHELSDISLAVYLLGDLPELGGGDIARSVKMVSDDGVHWRVSVSLPVGRGYQYQFYERLWPFPLEADNGDPIREPVIVEAVELPLRPSGKVFYAHSSFDAPVIHWRQDDGAFEKAAMREVGEGRSAEEKRWEAGPFGESQAAVEFFLTNSDESKREPEGDGTYQTPLEVGFLQDGELFTYVPASSVSEARRDYEVLEGNYSSTRISSEVLGEDYEYRVFLPRGYEEHTERSYPVVYLQDGYAAWDSGEPCDPDGEITAELVRQGQVGEMIYVAVASLVDSGCERRARRARDYIPPGSVGSDPECGSTDGEADRYVAFLVDELKPMIDEEYRTRPGAEDTFTTGVSYGGIAAFYMAWDHADTFSAGGVQSIGTAGTFPYFDRIVDDPKPSARIYLDASHWGELDVFNQALSIRDDLLGRTEDAFAIEDDLRYLAGESTGHSYQASGTRWPAMLSFFYPGSAEAPECYDGLDNDGDGRSDYAPGASDNDPDCTSALDPFEGTE